MLCGSREWLDGKLHPITNSFSSTLIDLRIQVVAPVILPVLCILVSDMGNWLGPPRLMMRRLIGVGMINGAQDVDMTALHQPLRAVTQQPDHVKIGSPAWLGMQARILGRPISWTMLSLAYPTCPFGLICFGTSWSTASMFDGPIQLLYWWTTGILFHQALHKSLFHIGLWLKPWWSSRLALRGPAKELCDSLFVPINRQSGLHRIHRLGRVPSYWLLSPWYFRARMLFCWTVTAFPSHSFEVADLWREA